MPIIIEELIKIGKAVSLMLAIERKNEILASLRNKQSVLVSELSRQYNVSEETIRRDLEKLEREGFVKKTYGGAVIRENVNGDVPLKIRQKSNLKEKQRIAEKVAQLIEDEDSIMMDSSSTAFYVARAVKQKKKLTIVTNSVEILLEYADAKNVNVISTGGRLRESSLSLVGGNTVKTIESYNVDKAIISCKGIDIEKGATESNELEAEAKRAMLRSAKQVILAVDGSKLDKVSFVKLFDLNRPNVVVTDNKLDGRFGEYFEREGVEVIY